MPQNRLPHPLGFHIRRDRCGCPTMTHRLREAWWIVIGRWSLHRAWQRGYDQHAMDASVLGARRLGLSSEQFVAAFNEGAEAPVSFIKGAIHDAYEAGFRPEGSNRG